MAAVLVACGGGSGGGSDSQDPTDPPPSETGTTFGVSGTVNGLIAPIQISDGYQTLDVSSNGTIAFDHRYQRGETFAVTLNAGNADQLCTLTHGAGLILGDVKNLAVDCLELRDANVTISKPKYYKTFDKLSLRSSYQYIPELVGETAKLTVAKSQFVTLYTSGEQQTPIYLAYVSSFDGIRVDALSTAVALVLLNPSIHGAVEERSAQFEFYAGRFAALDAVADLATLIEKKANDGGFDLQYASDELLAALDAAVQSAATDIIDSGVIAAKAVVTPEKAQKFSVVPDGTQQGVSLILQKLPTPDAAGNDHELRVSNNNQQRYIGVESALLETPLALTPNSSQGQPLNAAAAMDAIWTVYGPGAQAASSPVSTSLKQAVIDTASRFYAYPALAFETGRLNLPDLRVQLCMDEETLQQLREAANLELLGGDWLESGLNLPHYTAAYDAVTAPLRSAVVNNLDELLECEFFRQGHWLDTHIDTARVQLATVLNIAQSIYAPRYSSKNVLVTPGLLAAGNVINSSMTQQQWQLSNRLEIAITRNGVPVTGTINVNEGETLALAASCKEPGGSQPVECALQWALAGGGTISASEFTHTFDNSGNASIVVSASDADGATASFNVAVTIAELAPLPRLRNALGALVGAGSTYEFTSAVTVGTSADTSFTLKNEGTDVLNVGTIGITGSSFSVVSVSDNSLAPGESAAIVLRFSPSAVGVANAAVTIPMSGNEPQDTQTLSFNLRGTGVAAPVASVNYWIRQEGATQQRFDIVTAQTGTDTNDNLKQFRGFGSNGSSYPQISVSLPSFNGPGTYALDDLASGRGCLGFLAFAASNNQLWCTKTTAPFTSTPATGTATYSVGAQGQQVVDFDFQVVPAQCAAPGCTAQRVTGHIEVP